MNTLANQLNVKGKEDEGYPFEVQPIPGDIEVLQVTIEDRIEFPIYLSIADNEILCMTYLFKEDEVNTKTKDSMHQSMLNMNVAMPLSSFAKFSDQYVIFGSLSKQSNLDDIVHEIETLSDNTLEAIDVMKEFLQ